MTEQDLQTLEDARKYFEGFPEAPYSDSFKWVDQNGFEHLTTVRAWTGGTLLSGIDKATLAISNRGGKAAGIRPPAPTAEPQKVQATTEEGLPVVDGDQKPVMVELPQGVHLFSVKEVYHDTNKDGDKHMLKIVLHEQDYPYSNKKYGISCFHPGPEFTGWMDWKIGDRFAPPVKAAKVLVRDPKQGGKYADVLEFRPA